VNALGSGGLWLFAVGAVGVLWSVGLSIYVVISDKKRSAASLNALTDALSERLRRMALSS
jgi:hypothetical protein